MYSGGSLSNQFSWSWHVYSTLRVAIMGHSNEPSLVLKMGKFGKDLFLNRFRDIYVQQEDISVFNAHTHFTFALNLFIYLFFFFFHKFISVYSKHVITIVPLLWKPSIVWIWIKSKIEDTEDGNKRMLWKGEPQNIRRQFNKVMVKNWPKRLDLAKHKRQNIIYHYENKPIQIYWKIYQQNMKKIR